MSVWIHQYICSQVPVFQVRMSLETSKCCFDEFDKRNLSLFNQRPLWQRVKVAQIWKYGKSSGSLKACLVGMYQQRTRVWSWSRGYITHSKGVQFISEVNSALLWMPNMALLLSLFYGQSFAFFYSSRAQFSQNVHFCFNSRHWMVSIHL